MESIDNRLFGAIIVSQGIVTRCGGTTLLQICRECTVQEFWCSVFSFLAHPVDAQMNR